MSYALANLFRSFSENKSELILEPLSEVRLPKKTFQKTADKNLLESAALSQATVNTPPAPRNFLVFGQGAKSQIAPEGKVVPRVEIARENNRRSVFEPSVREARFQVWLRALFLLLPISALFGSLSILPFLSIRVFLFAGTGVLLLRAAYEALESLERYFRAIRSQARMNLLSSIDLARYGMQNMLIGASLIGFTLWGFQLFLANLPPILLSEYGFFFFGVFAFLVLIAVGLIWSGSHLRKMTQTKMERRRIPRPAVQQAFRLGQMVDLGSFFSLK